MQKLRVAVLKGGPSAEHDVSISSAKQIEAALNPQVYEIVPVFISKEGEWGVEPGKLKDLCDVALISAMHGEYGEDGQLQNQLADVGICYTGTGPEASHLCMDKEESQVRLGKSGIPVPQSIVYGAGEHIEESPYGYPVIVKPADRGSSVGTHMVTSQSELKDAVRDAQNYSDRVMVQEYIEGRELTCGVLVRDGGLVALPPTEIKTKTATFFDYKAKYKPGATEEITPADIPHVVTQELQNMAKRVYVALGARDYARVDFMYGKTNSNNKEALYVLEINTLPGMTETSLFPQGAAAAGITFPELLDMLITHAHSRRT